MKEEEEEAAVEVASSDDESAEVIVLDALTGFTPPWYTGQQIVHRDKGEGTSLLGIESAANVPTIGVLMLPGGKGVALSASVDLFSESTGTASLPPPISAEKGGGGITFPEQFLEV